MEATKGKQHQQSDGERTPVASRAGSGGGVLVDLKSNLIDSAALKWLEEWYGLPHTEIRYRVTSSADRYRLEFWRFLGDNLAERVIMLRGFSLEEMAKTREFLAANNIFEYNAADIMDKSAKALQPAADFYGLPLEEVRKAIEDLAARTARETTGRAKATPRLKWGHDRRDGEDPAHFAGRAYAAEMAAGALHRGVIRSEDPALSVKLTSWLRSHPMPDGIDIPTKPEWNTRQLTERGVDPGARETMRLYHVAKKRREKLAVSAPT